MKPSNRMTKGSGLSTRRAWVILLISLLDEIVLAALALLALWYFKVSITWPIILVIVVFMAGSAYLMHKTVVPALRRSKVTGREAMIGLTGRATEALEPEGTIIVQGEYWRGRSIEGKIDINENVEVVRIQGLVLEVKKTDE